jgi:Pyridoxamine 5'-phosphate oxidase
MSRTMTSAQVRAFLLHGTRTAKVATVMPDGTPHVAPVWFVLDDQMH